MEAEAVLASLTATADLRDRLRACGVALRQIVDDAKEARDRRDAELYAGLDRWGRAPSGCAAYDLELRPIEDVLTTDRLAAPLRHQALLTAYETGQAPPPSVLVDGDTWLVPVWVPCTGKHKARGLCMRHYRRLRRDPDWASVGLTAEPVTTAGWRKAALEGTDLTPYIFERILARRISKPRGYWRSAASGTVAHRLPDPGKLAATADEQWQRVRELNEKADALDDLAARIRDEVRNPALFELFPVEPSNKALCELADMASSQMEDLRKQWRQKAGA